MKKSIICKKNQRFESIFVCAINCRDKCINYKNTINIQILRRFVENHPQYEIIGEIMPTNNQKSKKIDTATPKKTDEKSYWILDSEGKVKEVAESEIINNPSDFFDREIWEKPPYQYELVISLKRKK